MAKAKGEGTDPIADQLAAAKRELETAQAELEHEQQAHAAEVQLKHLQRDAADARLLAHAERELGPIDTGAYGYVKTELGVVILKPPNELLWRRFQDQNNPSEETTRKFLDTCRFAPELELYEQILSAYPGVLGAIAKLVPRLAGYNEDRIVGGKD